PRLELGERIADRGGLGLLPDRDGGTGGPLGLGDRGLDAGLEAHLAHAAFRFSFSRGASARRLPASTVSVSALAFLRFSGSSSSASSPTALLTFERGADIGTGTPRLTATATSRSNGISAATLRPRARSISPRSSSLFWWGRFSTTLTRSV